MRDVIAGRPSVSDRAARGRTALQRLGQKFGRQHMAGRSDAGAACYGMYVPNRRDRASRALTVWDHDKLQWSNPDLIDQAADAGVGVVMLRPAMMKYAQEPVMLHEFLHVYHGKLMPNGYDNRGVIGFYAQAQSKAIYPKESYTMRNNREFFAETASIFLAGKDSVPRALHARQAEREAAGLLQVSCRRVRI